MIKILQPLLISLVIMYFNSTIDKKHAIIYASIISIFALTGCFFHHIYFFNAWRIGMRIRLAISGLIYKKIFKMSVKSLDSKCSAEIVNLLSKEATQLEISVLYLPYLLIGPLQILVVIAIVLSRSGVYFLCGLALLLVIIPAQAIIAKAYQNYK